MPNEIYHRSNWGESKAEGFGDVYYDHAATNKLYNHSDYYENSDGTDATLKDLNNKASIVLTPTAYSDGSLNTVIPPYQVLPTELVTNGDFSNGTTDWIVDDGGNGDISVVDGKLQITSNGGTGYPVVKQKVTTSIGKKYSVSFSVTSNTTGFWFRVNNSQSGLGGFKTFYSNDKTSSIIFKGEFTAISTNSWLKIFAEQNDAGSFKIDNVSVKEIQEADFDFSRGSSATRVNEQGLVDDSQGDDYPRIDFTDGTGSLLLEPQRTNLLPYSEDFSSLDPRQNAVVTSDAILSPSGLLNADEITFDGTSTGRVQEAITVTNNVSYTISLYLKNKNLSDTTQVWIGFSGNTQGSYVTITDEWQRYDITTTSNGTIEYPRIQFSGTGSLYAWGFQVEQGDYATSYIPTSGSTVTRSADVANNSGNADLFNDSEGVLYAEIAALANDSTNRAIAISDGTTSNVVRFYYSVTDNRIVGNVKSSGSTVFSYNNVLTDATDFIKVAVSYKANDFKMYVDGVQVSTDTSGAVPTGLVELAFDNGASADDFYGNTKAVAVFKEALSNDLLERLTGEGYESFRLLAEANNYTII